MSWLYELVAPSFVENARCVDQVFGKEGFRQRQRIEDLKLLCKRSTRQQPVTKRRCQLQTR